MGTMRPAEAFGSPFVHNAANEPRMLLHSLVSGTCHEYLGECICTYIYRHRDSCICTVVYPFYVLITRNSSPGSGGCLKR